MYATVLQQHLNCQHHMLMYIKKLIDNSRLQHPALNKHMLYNSNVNHQKRSSKAVARNYKGTHDHRGHR